VTEQVASFRLDGLVTDQPAFAVPPTKWTAVSQVNFRDGIAERRQGYAVSNSLTTPAACAPQFGLYVDVLGAASRSATRYLWYGGADYTTGNANIGPQTTTPTDSDVTPAGWAGTAPGRWTGGVLNNYVPVMNCQTEIPVYWNIAGPNWQVLPLSDPTGAAAAVTWTALRPYREFLIGMGLLVPASAYYSDKVYWSDAAPYNAPPTTWVAAATNQAGDAIIPGGGEVVDGAVLGEDFIIYKRRSCYRMRYVGGSYVMALSPLFSQFGALSQNCIAAGLGRHYVYTGDDLIVHDGQSWQSMLNGKARRLIRDNFTTLGDNPNAVNSHIYYNEQEREVWIMGVTAGNTWPTRAVVVDTDSGEAGLYTMPSCPTVFAGPLGFGTYFAYTGDGSASSGRFYRQDNGNTAAGTNITATLTRQALDFGKPEQRKTIRWVRPHLHPTGAAVTMGVEVGYADTPQASPTYTTSQNFVTGTTDKVNVLAASGRFISFRFTTADSVAHWQMSGFDVGYTLGGMT